MLLVLSNLGIGGPAGRYFASVFFGLFGILEYIFPILLFLLTAFFLANRKNARGRKKLICYFLFFICICAFMHMITEGYHAGMKLGEYYTGSSFSRSGGGLAGGLIVFPVGKAFGKYGCFAVAIFGMIITLCMATQKPLVSEAAERGLLARERLQALRERSLNRRAFLPYDEEEPVDLYEDDFDDYDEFDEEEEDLEEEEEIRPFRRSGKKNSILPKPEKKKSGKQKRAEKQTEKPDLFSDSFLFALDHREEEQKKASEAPAAKPSVSASVQPEEPSVLSGLSDLTEPDPFDLPELEDLPELTINKSEGAAAMEQEQTAAAEARENAGASSSRNPRSSKQEIEQGIENISSEIQAKEQAQKEKPYQFPPLELLKKGSGIPRGDSTKYLKETAATLEQVLRDFGVNVQVTDVSCGPSVTRYEVKPEQGVKVSRIVNLADDIKLNLAASNIRIEAPIPGKAAVGIEVPNKTVAPVLLRDLLESPEFKNHSSRIAFAVGKDIAGKTVVTDIARMPHLLIAGATGSGKSVCINTLIMSILYKASPDEVKLLMIDPKVVELSVYNGIPHLAIPVVTDPKKAAGALNWAVAEMSDRYNKFAEYGVREVAGYNAKVDALTGVPEDQIPKKMPQIVIVVDELADLMMVAPGEVEDAICRLAQLARAAGIHLIIATQRPSVNVVTGLIKANMPSRIALSVASGVDSRTIIDMNGAEKLLGHGDMLFYPQGYTQPARVQGGYVSDDEITEVVRYLADAHGEVTYDASIEAQINSSSSGGGSSKGGSGGPDQDELFIDAAKLIIDKDKASIGMLQRQFKIGFNRAARIMDQLCDAGVVGAEEGTKPRKVLLSKEQFENYLEEGRL